MAGLFFTGTGEFRGIAAGTMIVVATSVLGSVTVLPALLSKLGDRIEKDRIPLVRRLRRRNRRNGFWNGSSRQCCDARRPDARSGRRQGRQHRHPGHPGRTHALPEPALATGLVHDPIATSSRWSRRCVLGMAVRRSIHRLGRSRYRRSKLWR